MFFLSKIHHFGWQPRQVVELEELIMRSKKSAQYELCFFLEKIHHFGWQHYQVVELKELILRFKKTAQSKL